MKKLLALSLFGLVLGLTLSQTSTVEAKRDVGDEGKSKYGTHLTGCNTGFVLKEGKCKLYEIEDKDDDKNDDKDDDKYKGYRNFLTGCNTGFVLKEGECKKISKEKLEKNRKIRWNDFNDDLHKALKFLDLKSLTKEEKKSVSTTISQTRKDLKTIYKQMKTEYLSGVTVDFTGYVDKLTNEFNGFAADLKGYVKEGNEAKFEEYIKRKLKLISNFLTRKSEKK